MSVDYKDAGVDIHAGYEAVSRIKGHAASTCNSRVLTGLGSFGALYSIADMHYEKPVLVSGTDGVGTKLKLAFALDKHDTIGIDCVAMCVNDIVCQGAKPLFFLDYIATGKLLPEQVEQIVKGVADGCKQTGCALVGGETAEMPGFYSKNEYDVAGFAVGIGDKDKLFSPDKVKEGDVLVGLHSSGVHSNGFSLVRKLVGDDRESLLRVVDGIGPIGEALLTPTRLYVTPLLDVMEKFEIHGAAHITGGGFYENIPRMLPEGLQTSIKLGSWKIPALFEYLMKLGEMSRDAAFNTFNMGIGMVLAVKADQAEQVVSHLNEIGYASDIIGKVVKGNKEAVLA